MNRSQMLLEISTCAATQRTPSCWWRPLPTAPTQTRRGKAVQVDPIKTTLKVPRAKRLKLKSAEPLSNFAFSFTFRRYIVGHCGAAERVGTRRKMEARPCGYWGPRHHHHHPHFRPSSLELNLYPLTWGAKSARPSAEG